MATLVMVNGIPGNMGKIVAETCVKRGLELVPFSLTGEIIVESTSNLKGSEEFVTRKITISVAKIKAGLQEHVELGNLNASRDWGHSADYVRAMWLMLQQDKADDYVVATGKTHTVREFVSLAFLAAGMELEFHGEGVQEYATLKGTDRILVKVNPEFFRPAEVDLLIGDATKAKTILGWEPEITYEELVNRMVKSDIQLLVEGKI